MGDEKIPYSPSSDGKDINNSYRSLLIQEQIKRESVAQLALTTPRTELCVRASIIGTEKCQNPKRDKLHINYIIRVTTGIPNLSWHVHRRYKQFLNLHTQLLEVFAEKELPKLPPKSVGRKFKETFTIKRTKELNDYLTVLAQNTRVSRSEQWASFLVGVFDDIFEHARVKDLQASIALRPTNGQVGDISKPVHSVDDDEEDSEKTIRELKAQLASKDKMIDLLRVERDKFKAEVDVQLNKIQEINFQMDELKQNNLDLESQVKELKQKEESMSIYRDIVEKSPRPLVPEPSPTPESDKSTNTEKRSSTKKSNFFGFGKKEKNGANHKDREQESDSRDRIRAKTELHPSATNHKSQSSSPEDTKEPARNFVNHASASSTPASSPVSDMREPSPFPGSQQAPSQLTKEQLDLLQQQKATIEAQEKLIQSLTEEKAKSLAEVTNENVKLKAQKKLLVKEIRSLRRENPSLPNPPQMSPPPSPTNSPSKKKKENKIDKSAIPSLNFQFSSSSSSTSSSS